MKKLESQLRVYDNARAKESATIMVVFKTHLAFVQRQGCLL